MIGRFVISRAGHDKDQLYVVVGQEADCVFVCDGKTRTLARPKKKKEKHVQPINRCVNDDLLKRLREASGTGQTSVRDEEIKYEIRQYLALHRNDTV